MFIHIFALSLLRHESRAATKEPIILLVSHSGVTT